MLKMFILQGDSPMSRDELTIISKNSELTDIEVIERVQGEFSAAQFTSSNRHPAVIVVDGSASISAIGSVVAQIGALPASGMTIFNAASDDASSLPEMRISEWLRAISAGQEFAPVAMYCDSRSLSEIGNFSGHSGQELFMAAAISAMANGVFAEESRVSASESSPQVLSAQSSARLVRKMIELSNIEDLFPSLAWSSHGDESAAAAYHSLTALFIRFGDLSSANECIALSDSFEDSPRALALKGMIARMEGETLAAVANMVSSLQQYEQRKHADGKHYLSFTPTNFEEINSSLQAGLEALNKRDNEAALSCFSKAVLNFDPFYREWGIAERM